MSTDTQRICSTTFLQESRRWDTIIACALLEADIPTLLDSPVVIWAAHGLGAIVSPANPSFTAPELQYQIERTKAGLIFAYPDPESLYVARKAAKSTGIPVDRIVVLEEDGSPLDGTGSVSEGMTRYEDLLELGLVRGHDLAAVVEDEEPRAGGALVDGADKGGGGRHGR